MSVDVLAVKPNITGNVYILCLLYLLTKRVVCLVCAYVPEFGGLMTELAAQGQQVRLQVFKVFIH